MSNTRATRPRLHYLAERIGVAAFLDGPAEAVAGWVRGAVPRGPVKDTLSVVASPSSTAVAWTARSAGA